MENKIPGDSPHKHNNILKNILDEAGARLEPGWSQAGDAMFLLVVPVALTKFVKINHKY